MDMWVGILDGVVEQVVLVKRGRLLLVNGHLADIIASTIVDDECLVDLADDSVGCLEWVAVGAKADEYVRTMNNMCAMTGTSGPCCEVGTEEHQVCFFLFTP